MIEKYHTEKLSSNVGLIIYRSYDSVADIYDELEYIVKITDNNNNVEYKYNINDENINKIVKGILIGLGYHREASKELNIDVSEVEQIID